MKNIDKIKSMNTKELANLISDGACKICSYEVETCSKPCVDGVAEWLEQEVELTPKDCVYEHELFCNDHLFKNGCDDCKYNKSPFSCETSYIYENFNIINGKITRRG